MKITHRAPADASVQLATAPAPPSAASSLDKAPRLSCCCRLSELMPLLRQAHDAARAARQSTEQPSVAA